MATKLKLKTVFVLYFMVSLLGLVYALMQLGKLSYRNGKNPANQVLYFAVSLPCLQGNAATVQSMTCPKIGP